MTLDKRIEKDLDDLYNKGEIDGAKDLDDLVKTDKSKYRNLQNLANTPEMQKQKGISVSCGTIYSKMFVVGVLYFGSIQKK